MAIVEEKYEVWRKLAHSVLRNYGEWRIRAGEVGENAQGTSLGMLSREDVEDIFHAVLEKYVIGPGEERFLSWCQRKEVDATRGFLGRLPSSGPPQDQEGGPASRTSHSRSRSKEIAKCRK